MLFRINQRLIVTPVKNSVDELLRKDSKEEIELADVTKKAICSSHSFIFVVM